MKAPFVCLLIILVAVATLDLQAHGIWFAERSGALAMVDGEGAEDGDMVKRLPLVRGVAAYDASGGMLEAKLMPSDHLLFVDTQHKPVVVTGVLDNGLWRC